MKQTFEVLNVKCGGCANTVKKALRDEYGEVDVNLEVMPRQITLEIEEDKVEGLKTKLKSLGYPVSDEKLSNFEKVTTTAKSFVSCAIGKMDS